MEKLLFVSRIKVFPKKIEITHFPFLKEKENYTRHRTPDTGHRTPDSRALIKKKSLFLRGRCHRTQSKMVVIVTPLLA